MFRITDTGQIDGDFGFEIALGNVKDVSTIYKFGSTKNITINETVLWDGADTDPIYPFQTVASTLSVVSNNANDTIGGTGARTIRIYGLDENFELQEEVISLNGTTPVITTKSFIRVYRVRVETTGDGVDLPNAGNISLTCTSNGDLQAKILTGNGQTSMAVFTVPAGYDALVPQATYSAGEGKNITMNFKFRPFGGAFNVSGIREVFEQNSVIDLYPPFKAEEKMDIVMTGRTTSGTYSGGGSFNIILVKKND